MMTYDRNKRITWEELFEDQSFNLDLLKENFDPLLHPPLEEEKFEKIDYEKIK